MNKPSLARITGGDSAETADAGFTLVEMMVAITLVTGAILALLGMIAGSLQTHRSQRDEAGAERAASTYLETARNLTFTELVKTAALPVQTLPFSGSHGIIYNVTPTVTSCLATDRGSACTLPSNPATPTSPAAQTDVHIKVHVTWTEAGKAKALDVTTGVSDVSSNTSVPGSGGTTVGSLVGGISSATAGISTSITNLSVAPTSVSVNGQGHPLSSVTVTATLIGLPSSSSFPITWTDDTGGHQATMTNTGATTWAATLKTTDITRAITVSQPSATVAFTAVVPGSKALPSTTLTLTALAPPTLSCTVAPVAIVLSPLTAKTTLPTTLACTAGSLAATDVVTVSYLTSAGRVMGALTSPTGTAWSLTLPAGTALPVNPLTAFAFTATRALDSAQVTANATAAVA